MQPVREPVRVGVVGLGQIAQIMHIPYLLANPVFKLEAVCDLSAELVQRVGELYHVPGRYVDAHEMIDCAPLDAVLVCSNFDHAPIALDAIEHGRHVLIEKPLCESPALAREIAEAADRANVRVMVAYMKRYDPGFVRWQREIKGLSGIRLARAHDFCHNNNLVIRDAYDLFTADDIPPAARQAAVARWDAGTRAALGRDSHGSEPPANILAGYRLGLGLGVHDMTIVRGSFGDPKAVLFSDIAREGAPTTVAVLDYESFRLTWEVGNTDTKQMDQELALWARDAIVALRFPSPYIKNIPTELTVTRTEGDETITTKTVASYREAFQNEVNHFAECVTQGRKPMTDAWDGLRDIELLLEIARAAWH